MKTIKATLPLSGEQIYQAMVDQDDVLWELNWKQIYEALKDKAILYIDNIELNVQIDFDDCDYQQKCEALKQWLNCTKIHNIREFSETLIHIVACYRGYSELSIFDNSIFDQQQCRKWINENNELVERIDNFIISTILFVLKQLSIKKVIVFDVDKFEKIDDENAVCKNVVNVFTNPKISVLFSDIDLNEAKYYVKQFDENIWNHVSFHHYFYVDGNVFAGFVEYFAKELSQ